MYQIVPYINCDTRDNMAGDNRADLQFLQALLYTWNYLGAAILE